MLVLESIHCPYCGESIDLPIDPSAGSQQYIEDCHVCCRPINVVVDIDDEGVAAVHARGENEA